MKQKKFGKKIQNWHRPLGRDALSQRYRRRRFDHTALSVGGATAPDADEPPVASDRFWNLWDPFDCWEPFDEYEGDNQVWLSLSNFLDRLISPRSPKLASKTARSRHRIEQLAGPTVAEQLLLGTTLESRLRNFERILRGIDGEPTDLVPLIAARVDDTRSILVLREVLGWERARDLCLYAPFWIRHPSSWNPDGKVDLIAHLFVRHEIPASLARVRRLGLQAGHKWFYWFLLFGQGGSLKRASRHFGNWKIQGKFAHHFYHAPQSASPLEACLYAEVMRMGGTLADYARIRRHPALLCDPTGNSGDFARFWEGTVQWLIAHRTDLTDDDCRSILNWAIHEYTERRRRYARPFSWNRRTPIATRARAAAYQANLQRPGGSSLRWRKQGWDWRYQEEDGGEWSFTELTNSENLRNEGQTMQHCVASYAWRCAQRNAAIVSLKLNGERRVTIEVNPRTLRVVQVRGKRNRAAQPQEQRVIGLWAQRILLGPAASDD